MKFKSEVYSDTLTPEEDDSLEVLTQEVVVISDLHNDIEGAHKTLQAQGVVDDSGEWVGGITDTKLILTGDIINRNEPDLDLLRWLYYLKASAPEGCEVIVLAGNHEIDEIIRLGQKIETKKKYRLLSELKVLHIEGDTLLFHGYPTVKLLEMIISGGVDGVNQMFKDAVGDFSESGNKKSLKHFAFSENKNDLLRDIDPGTYYAKHGKKVKKLLSKLGIRIVMHGHKPTKNKKVISEDFGKVTNKIDFLNLDTSRKKVLGKQKIRTVLTQEADLDGIMVTADCSIYKKG